MTRGSAAARRYARALLALAAPTQSEDAIGQELAAFQRLLETEAQLREVLLRPWVKAAVKRALVLSLAEPLRLRPLTRNFLALVAQQRRLPILGDIVTAYQALADEAAGRIRARVRSAAPLSNTERAALRERLGRQLGKTVLLETEVDSTLLGGFVAEVGSRVLDASLRGQLTALRERITKGASA